MERYKVFPDWKSQMALLAKAIYKFHVISLKIPMAFFKVRIKNIRFVGNYKCPRRAKTILI